VLKRTKSEYKSFAMSSAAEIRSQLEAQLSQRIPSALTPRAPFDMPTIPTGVRAIDSAIDGIPCGGITEITGPASRSVGRKSLLVQMLVSATREHFCALVDATDSFDPRSAQSAGVNLKRVQWIRCGGRSMKTLEQAFKAADILLQGSSGFGLSVVDLTGIPEKFVRKIPLMTWFRFSRVIERLPAALVFVTPYPVIGTCASVTLRLSSGQIRWSYPAEDSPTHAIVFAGLDFQIGIQTRRTFRKLSQSAGAFSAQPRWA
jgi:hypothetical protein